MKLLYHPVFLDHQTGTHPETHRRLAAFGAIPETEIIDGEPFLKRVHSAAYIESVKAACAKGSGLDHDTVMGPGSYQAACRAVGAAVMASRSGDFALARPPGHHAYPDHGSGFCLFNNIAIAASLLADEGKRVLVFDFDGHLGDGTSRIFYQSDQVLYWSIHQYPAFPGTGFVDEIGDGPGKGYTLNLPIPPGSGDDLFLGAIHAILPLAKQFAPDVVAVSAGFDAYQRDPLLNLRVSASGFHQVGATLRSHFPSIFAVLEGGYNIEALPRCVENFVCGINGLPIPQPEAETVSDPRIRQQYESNLSKLKAALAPYWNL